MSEEEGRFAIGNVYSLEIKGQSKDMRERQEYMSDTYGKKWMLMSVDGSGLHNFQPCGVFSSVSFSTKKPEETFFPWTDDGKK